MNAAARLRVRLAEVRDEAEGIRSLLVEPCSAVLLPAYGAGAHIDLYLPNGMVRSYSLCNGQGEDGGYRVAVSRDAHGRGGSRFVHDQLRVGDQFEVGSPRNHFPLNEQAVGSVLIAGGIGITPLWAMAQRLSALGRPWQLFFAARSRRHAAFVRDLEQLAQSDEQLHFHFDDEHGGRPLNLESIVAAAAPEHHLYCCGPRPMLAAFEAATGVWPADQVHLEHFSATQPKAESGGFTVSLARSGISLPVASGESILDVLLAAGIQIEHLCREGHCGTCETRVCTGIPDHRDVLLTPPERASNKTMMVCCSGSKTPILVLDI